MSAKDQLAKERQAWRQQDKERRRQIQVLQRDLERERAIRVVEINQLEARLGAPIIKDLILAFNARMWAADPLRGAPMEDTMRVSNPSSEKMGDQATKMHRDILIRAKSDVRDVIRMLKKGMGEPPIDKPLSPRCRKQDCELKDKRQGYGQRYCRACHGEIS